MNRTAIRPAKSDRRRSWPKLVYFIEAEGADAIKIGFCHVNLQSRITALQACCPQKLTLLGIVFDGRKMEKLLHRQFADERIRGEWFYASSELRQYIREHASPLTKGTPDEPEWWTSQGLPTSIPTSPAAVIKRIKRHLAKSKRILASERDGLNNFMVINGDHVESTENLADLAHRLGVLKPWEIIQ